HLVLARPLLGTWRREIEASCGVEALDPRLDPSNRSPRFLRNRVRHELLPLLRGLNPGIDRGVLRLAENAGQAAGFLDDETERVWRRVARRSGDGVLLRRDPLAALPPSLLRQVLRRALLEVRGNLRGIAQVHVSNMAQLAAGPAGKTLHLPGELRFHTGYDAHTLGLDDPDTGPPSLGETPLRVPGVTELPGWRVEAELAPANEVKAAPSRYTALLDPALAARPLLVRSRRPGDRFQPIGLGGSKKLQDYLVDAKVPRSWRDRVPLLCADGEIIWVVGYRTSERARAPSGDGEALRVAFHRRRHR
ncbi:MAG: tRNA lysidine(34) synthetase TilS, partial [Dehalococcoidia bacterium]